MCYYNILRPRYDRDIIVLLDSRVRDAGGQDFLCNFYTTAYNE